jgi:hypothetical protein
MEVVRSPETLIYTYKSTQRGETSTSSRRDNLKSHVRKLSETAVAITLTYIINKVRKTMHKHCVVRMCRKC